MEGFRDRADDALRKAAAPTLERIRNDAGIDGLPTQVKRLLVYLETHLFDRRLTVTAARKSLGIGDNSVSTEFGAWLGCTPFQYLRRRRLETAARMLAATDLQERRIARAVGFTSYDSFASGYKAWTGKAPSQDRKQPAPGTEPPAWHRILHGELTAEEARHLIDELHRIYPGLDEVPPRRQGAAPPRTVIDGADYERFRATELWERIRAMPFDEQKRHLRGYVFRSTALFDLLRKTSREEGRKDREHGIRIAELALVSLEKHDEVFGDRIHDLRALGWAWLANARRLALDFEGAEADIARADREWSTPRADKNLAVMAQIQLLHGGLRMCQRHYPDALKSLDESIRLSQLEGSTATLAEALIQRASVRGYMECLRDAAADLRSAAAALIDRVEEPYLNLKLNLNQANLQIRLGDYDAAATMLAEAATCSKQLDHQLEWYEVLHLEGNLKERIGDPLSAEESFLAALEGFVSLNELRSAVFVALDLAIHFFRQGKRRRALDLASWTIPVLQTIDLHTETLAAIELLACELQRMRVDQGLLCRVVRLLELDPLVRLGEQTRVGWVSSRPSCLRG